MLTSLLTTVAERQVADVPLGAFLSDGVDSSLVVALMQERTTTQIQTFTIRFNDPEYIEADHAATVARHLGTEHHEQMCDAGQMLGVVDRLPGMFDEPIADSSAVPTFLLAAVAQTRVTVALSGDGADELFFDYPRYRHIIDSAWTLKLPQSLRKVGARAASRLPTRRLRRVGDVLGGDGADSYARFIGWWTADAVHLMTGVASFQAPTYSEVMNRAAQLPRQDVPLADLVTYLLMTSSRRWIARRWQAEVLGGALPSRRPVVQIFSLIGWSRSISQRPSASMSYGPAGNDWAEPRMTRLDSAHE